MIFVMAGLAPAIHVFGLGHKQGVDGRHKAGHDGVERKLSSRERLKNDCTRCH
jgi:hypothetical protein